MFEVQLQDVIIAVAFFAFGFLAGVGTKVELKQLWLGKKRHGKKSKH